MTKPVVLSAAERAALTALIDGDKKQRRRMSPAIRARLSELRLIERREWPDGPPWRTPLGKRVVRDGK